MSTEPKPHVVKVSGTEAWCLTCFAYVGRVTCLTAYDAQGWAKAHVERMLIVDAKAAK